MDPPTTPPASTSANPIHSTPANKTNSRGITSAHVYDVKDVYEDELKTRTETVKFHTFLLFLLSLVMKKEDTAVGRLSEVLQSLLSDAVLMCNADRMDGIEEKTMESAFSEPVGGGQREKKMNGLQNLLLQFREVKGERGRYEPFCKLANNILEMMREKPGRSETDLHAPRDGGDRLVFQCNDPMTIKTDHVGIDNYLLSSPTIRKPDVIGLALRDALLTAEVSTDGIMNWLEAWNSHAFGSALKVPKSRTTFRKLQVGIEFKDTGRHMARIPLEFDGKLQEVPAREIITPPETVPEGGVNVRVSNKRKSDDVTDEPSKKLKKSSGSKSKSVTPAPAVHTYSNRVHAKDPEATSLARKLPPNVQVAIYAAERLSSSITINHSLQFIIIDSTIWLWWFDRCGAIQSGGMNFITNLPYLVVLLDILRRFDEHAWGLNDLFRETGDVLELDLHGPGPQPANITVTLNARDTPLSLHLFSRGTAVVPATSEDPSPISPNEKLSDYKMVAKIYHVDEQRDSEISILAEAYKVAAKPTNEAGYVRGHLPVLFASRDWEGEYAERVERILKISPTKGKRRFRRLRVLLFQELEPIYKLSGKEFMKVFRDCFLCHGVLWQNNIHHRDISENNLMFRRMKDGVVGVLNDFDLSIVHRDDRTLAKERTGTIPFMSHALLKAFNSSDNVPHLYEYDVESFAYVGLWISARYEDGEVANHDAYRGWTKAVPPPELAASKREALTENVDPTSSHEQHSEALTRLGVAAEDCIRKAIDRKTHVKISKTALPPALAPESVKDYFERLSLTVFTQGMPGDYLEYFQKVDTAMKDDQGMDGVSRWCYLAVSEQMSSNALTHSNDPKIVN
ncbi:hypothetical protein NEOLEDRAFT_1113837 [Neolentinus lepideus HHB14362 ss-1]|uniref:Fungal-type protein kinase domain-containing protein n=1 Tax=Neolentinus lepideus HHB14362 ss-1 TaxID=1314782 RepID=A0A165T0S3_9AGAM|nr:hypothetical protein NEOLEDRAFT_1113837 [Neolentinus lepideus HHB14362 ss-1]